MAFQFIFDKAVTISGNNRAVVGQSITRNHTVRAVSRGSAVQKFTITMPALSPVFMSCNQEGFRRCICHDLRSSYWTAGHAVISFRQESIWDE